MTWIPPDGNLSGAALRWAVCICLRDAGRPLRVDEIVRAVEALGFGIVGRPGKTVSDALRWEVGRRRVVQQARGLYVAGRMPKSTERSMRQRVYKMRLSLVATTSPYRPGPDGRVGSVSEDELSLVARTSFRAETPVDLDAMFEGRVADPALNRMLDNRERELERQRLERLESEG